MKLLFLIDFKNPNLIAGGQYSIIKLAEKLSATNEVFVCYNNHRNLVYTDGLIFFKCLQLPRKYVFCRHLNILIEKLYDFAIINYLIKFKNIDYIIGSQVTQALKAYSWGKRNNISIVNFIFETPPWLIEQWPEWGEYWNSSRKLRSLWNDFKAVLQDTNIIIANSKLTAAKATAWIGKEVSHIIYPGIPMASNNTCIKKEEQIIYLGRLERNKNVDEIIKALAIIDLKIKLVICGQGSQLSILKEMAKNLHIDVIFLGKVDEETKWQELKKSRLLIFPTSFEGFGMPPLEALSVGTPCIVSDIPILKEVYQGYIDYFTEHDTKSLAAKIKYYFENPSYGLQRGTKGKKYVLEHYSWEKSSEKLQNILECFLKRKTEQSNCA